MTLYTCTPSSENLWLMVGKYPTHPVSIPYVSLAAVEEGDIKTFQSLLSEDFAA